MPDGEIEELGVEGEDELEHDVGEGLAHDITGHQDVIVHPATLDVDLSDGDLGGKVGLGPGHDVNVCFLLDFVVTLGNEVLGKVDGSSACQVQVRVQPGRSDDVEGGGAPGTERRHENQSDRTLYYREIYVQSPRYKHYFYHKNFPAGKKG